MRAYVACLRRAIENKDITKFQLTILTMMAALRRLSRSLPWMVNDKVWRLQGATADMVLTLVPPHRTMGPLTEWLVEPIYCGAFHQSTNICTFCPGRDFMTLNFVVEERHLPKYRSHRKADRSASSLSLT